MEKTYRIDDARFEQAESLFQYDEFLNGVTLRTALLHTQWTVQQEAIRDESNRDLATLNRMLNNAHSRFTDILTRLRLVEHLKQDLYCDDNTMSGEWFGFGALCVKDFHIDVGSLMDALAAVIVTADVGFSGNKNDWMPSFSSIQNNQKNKANRSKLTERAKEVIDSSEIWWSLPKTIRDTVVHRAHLRMAFDSHDHGIFIQIYTGPGRTMIQDAFFQKEGNENVIDFRRYCAYVFTRILCFVDDVGEFVSVTRCSDIEERGNPKLAGDFSYILDEICRLRVDSRRYFDVEQA